MKHIKIVNMKKFIRSIVVILGIAMLLTFLLTKASLSHNENEQMNYGTISVCEGDTLWEIAINQKQNNPYYQDKDVRFVVNELRKLNGLNNANLQIGQELKIPVL